VTATIRSVRFLAAKVSPKTIWTFAEIETNAGVTGVGEATLNGQEAAVSRQVEALVAHLVGQPARPDGLRALPAPKNLVEAAARSSVDLALRVVDSKVRGIPLVEALGGARRSAVPIYANINRRTLDRTPAGFAASARDAIAAGFGLFKIAPFDEAMPAACADDPKFSVVEPGLARIAAVREAIGPDRELMVDCHWRLTEAAARHVLRETAGATLYWLECPLPETEAELPAIARLRKAANEIGVRLAGCETAVGVQGFRPFLDAGAYDVMMPDVKYVGGLDEIMRVADALEQNDVGFSPHNPSGPICHLGSLHVSAAVRSLDRLEMQFDESPLFDELVDWALPPVREGTSECPAIPGLGASLRHDLLD
jgi:galactonate dehydratase